MATVLDSGFIRRQHLHRLRHRDLDFEEDQRFERCDFTCYCYFVLSLVLFSAGTVITVLALTGAGGYISSQNGHMWLVGPVFISSGMMVAVKSMLYLRRKSDLQMLLHQRAIIRDLATARVEQAYANGQVGRTDSTATLPPTYDALIGGAPVNTAHTSTSEPPPPTYEEAMFLIGDEKVKGQIQESSSKGSITCNVNDINMKP